MQLLFRAFCCGEVLLGQCERHRARLWCYLVFVMDGRCGLRSEAELGDLADLLES
jgi:hypothetical protein